MAIIVMYTNSCERYNSFWLQKSAIFLRTRAVYLGTNGLERVSRRDTRFDWLDFDKGNLKPSQSIQPAGLVS